MILGISGPVGSGKSEVCKILKRYGAYIIEADQIGHDLVQEKWADVVKAFGSKVLQRGGKVDRRKLGDLVFSDPAALKRLNALTHPEIKKRIVEIVESIKGKHKIIVINAALLKEIELIPLCDQVWIIAASRKNRIRWLLKKGKLDRKKINNIIKSQMNKDGYEAIADQVIDNNGTKNSLREKVGKLRGILI